MMNAICAGFLKAPRMCKYTLETQNFNSEEVIFMQPRYSYAKVFLMCTLIMVVVSIILCLYRRHAKRRMKQEINVKIEEAVN